MNTHNYTFMFVTEKGQTITAKHKISDDLLLGIGFGIYIYNKQKFLPEDTESISVDGNINLVVETRHDAFMPDGWSLEGWLSGDNEEEPERYVIHYKTPNNEDIYATFKSPDFIQGVHTTFLWLGYPKLKKFTTEGEIYDTQLKTRIFVN